MIRPTRTVAGEWAVLSFASAAAVTVLDAVLLQLRRSFFTGGFLSVDHADRWVDRVGFLAGSLATDLVITGLGVAGALLVAGWLQLGRVARWFLAACAGTAPLVVASLVAYQVLSQLGDAFDFFLMFDLVGRRPSEIFAVASGQLVTPALLLAGGVLAVAGVTWVLTRRYPAGARVTAARPVLLAWLVLACSGIVVMTGLRLASEVMDNGLRRKPAGQLLGTIVGAVSDVDRDGYGLMSRPADPNPWDARIYPYALDIPGNGIDENGVGGDLPVGPAFTEPSGDVPAFAWTPDIVVVMLETFRADVLEASEGGREITSVLNRLAREGASAARAYSHNGYTVQSRHHLFTGSLAGLRAETIIDDFRHNGYEVAYFSAQDESFGGTRYGIGIERADVFYDARQDRNRRYTTFATPGSLGVPFNVVLERVQAFLASRDASRPLLLYVNFYDTHFPYHHDGMAPLIPAPVLPVSSIVPARAADLRAMYRNAAANVDAAVGRLLDDAGRYLGALPAVVALADHGESLFEEGFLGHGYAINDVQTRIPFIVRGLPIDVCEPIGQADLRDALRTALSRPDDGRTPRFRQCDAQRVFQYLGSLDRPRQIALTGAAGRVIHDFRQNRVRFDDQHWQHPDGLDATQRSLWLELVHFWERMRLAQEQAQGEPAAVTLP